MPSFFEDLATGFFKGAGQSYAEKRQDTRDYDAAIRNSVLSVNTNKAIMEAKAEIENKQRQQQIELNRQMFSGSASEQTANMFSQPQPTARSGPAVDISEQLPTELASDDELGVAPVELSSPEQSIAPPPATKAPMTLEQATALLPPEKQAVVYGYINGADKNGYSKAQKYVADELVRQSAPELVGDKEEAKLKAKQEANIIPAEELEQRRQMAKLPVMAQARNRSKVDEKALSSYDEMTWSGKDARSAIAANTKMIGYVNKFVKLNKDNTTGGIAAVIPFINSIRATMDSEFAAMEGTAAVTLINSMADKGLGSGTAVSDQDRETYAKAGLSTMKPGKANDFQAASLIGIAQADNEYREFAMEARRQMDAEPADIDRMWKEYSNANPIFDKGSTVGNIKVNTERLPWREYFTAKESGTLDEAKMNARGKFQMNGMPGKPNAQAPKDSGVISYQEYFK